VTALTTYWTIFYNNILPIFIAAGGGFVLGRALKPDLRTTSRLAFFLFSPCLVFNSVTQTTLSGADFAQVAVFTLVIIALMTLVALAIGVALRLDRRLLATLVVASIFVNGGNYGLALTTFAFGEAALARAVIYYTFSTLAVYTLGVVIAAWGQRPLGSLLRHGLTLPTTYALAGAGLVRLTGIQLPLPAERAVGLLSQAALPVMLVVLGLQLAQTRTWPRARLGLILLASFLQLVVAPLLGLGLAHLLGLTGPTYQAAVIETAMPTAVITTILAVEYDLDSAFITGTVIVSTLLSPLTLTPLIAYLQR
jgi:malate permease and related proteins